MVCLPAASRPAAPVLFLRLHELLGNDQLALELALVVLELLVAPVLGIFERLAARTSWLPDQTTRRAPAGHARWQAGSCAGALCATTQKALRARCSYQPPPGMRRLSAAEKRRRGRRSCSGLASTSVRPWGETGLGMEFSNSPLNATYILGNPCLT